MQTLDVFTYCMFWIIGNFINQERVYKSILIWNLAHTDSQAFRIDSLRIYSTGDGSSILKGKMKNKKRKKGKEEEEESTGVLSVS